MITKSHILILTLIALSLTTLLTHAADPELETRTLAVLPFLATDPQEKKLAERMRFAVSQKLSNDADGGRRFDRMDNVKIDQLLSALQIPWSTALPPNDELEKLLTTLDTTTTIAGIVKDRKLTLILYEGTKETNRAEIQIPPDRESPKLAIEQILTNLTSAKFAQLRQVEADHSDPATEARFAANPNLVIDPHFPPNSISWTAILGPNSYHPPTLSTLEKLQKDRVAIVPKALAGDPKHTTGNCLLLRMSQTIADNNGLACISTWIPVEQNKKYRFTCNYFSKGPVTHLFINGYATMPDQYGGGGDKNDPEATRRQLYRAQVIPTKKNKGFERMEMDFTPSSLKPTDPKIEWIRVNLYVYLGAGDIFFDDIIVKKLDE